MILLDFVYFICCSFYRKSEKDTFKSSGLVLMALPILMNVALWLMTQHSDSGQLKFII